MRWQQAWRQAALATLLTGIDLSNWIGSGNGFVRAQEKSWTTQRKLAARNQTRELWDHGFNNYMSYAFPLDELMPLSCTGRGPDWENPHNIAVNDVAGNFSLTLIDVLDTFVAFEDRDGFENAVRATLGWVSMDVNTKPQVFETTIRVLGGLLSAHIFASDKYGRFYLPWYRGQLLDMAHDLGKRMLPAFATPTGIPYARLNLRHGVPYGESLETCTAGAGSLILEFGTLSRLTGDDRFEKAAYRAFFALWNRKSDIGLVGNTINTWTGKWLVPEVTGIGAGIDSFYEYAFKWFILSGEVEFLDVWHEAYAAIMRYSRGSEGFWFRPVNIHSGETAYHTIDSLSAFWPGLQVLAGDVENAIKSHLIYWNLWKRNSGMPEVWDINYMIPVATQYPLRPEFAESTYYLYRATRDPFYLDVGDRILRDLTLRAKVECGLTGIADLATNKRDDRMESFVLSETLKYLYLLFDESNFLHKGDSNYIFTTEGHILKLDTKHLKPLPAIRRKLRRAENLTCPTYRPLIVGNVEGSGNSTGLTMGVLSRSDIDYARTLVAVVPLPFDKLFWSPERHCDVPLIKPYLYDFILTANGKPVQEDHNPSSQKLYMVDDGFVLQNVSGVRTHIVSRLDGKGYDIVKLGPYAVRRGQIVYVNDTDLIIGPVDNQKQISEDHFSDGRSKDVHLRFYLDELDPILQNQPGSRGSDVEFTTTGFTAVFGGDPTRTERPGYEPLRFSHGTGNRLVHISTNYWGCRPYETKLDLLLMDAVVLVHRGECTFLEKLVNAAEAGAAGVVVISDEEKPMNASADESDADVYEDLINQSALIVVTKSAGQQLLRLFDTAEAHGFSDVLIAVEPERRSGVAETEGSIRDERGIEQRTEEQRNRDSGAEHVASEDPTKILYINGHPLRNTRLLI